MRSSQPLVPTAATTLHPLVAALLGSADIPIAIRCWDGSTLGEPRSSATLVINSPQAVRRLVWSPNELGLGRAYVAGEIDVEGDVFAALGLREVLAAQQAEGAPVRVGLGWRGWLSAIRAARALGAFGRPLPPPEQEAQLRGRRHSKARDAAAISHHYDLSNEFYEMVLGETMTYSCAYFIDDTTSLDDAQRTKYEVISRKLGLQPGMRLLDVGCGWGGMLLHAAQHYGVRGVGVTLSQRQAERATERIAHAGLSDRLEVRVQDYRDIDDGPFDAISSIGMFEHVGHDRLAAYFADLYDLLTPEGRLLNHGISRPASGDVGGRPKFDKHGFIERYVFPDGELHEVGSVVSLMQQRGFEVRDVESLREHYARTLRQWVTNLEANWERAVELVGPSARIWRLYMAGSALNFEANRTNIHQVLGVKTGDDGSSRMPWVPAYRNANVAPLPAVEPRDAMAM
jgi:cyclopropane-fatty-acyl-phospholipid synthase